MAWVYFQCNGLLMSADRSVTLHCYAGIDEGKNSPQAQSIPNKGPLPRGRYTAEPPENSETHGPFAMRLRPHAENIMFGRSAFMYHADSLSHPGRASNGCIVSMGTPQISGRAEREIFWNSNDHEIEVRSGLQEV